jgi:hypothetical protein
MKEKTLAWKRSENNGHKKVMVHVRGQNFKNTMKEENFGLRTAQWTGQQLCFLLSPEGQSVLRKKRKILLKKWIFRGQPGPSSGVK